MLGYIDYIQGGNQAANERESKMKNLVKTIYLEAFFRLFSQPEYIRLLTVNDRQISPGIFRAWVAAKVWASINV